MGNGEEVGAGRVPGWGCHQPADREGFPGTGSDSYAFPDAATDRRSFLQVSRSIYLHHIFLPSPNFPISSLDAKLLASVPNLQCPTTYSIYPISSNLFI